jgi:predicted DsbA family dithiol-disulfide isomerase
MLDAREEDEMAPTFPDDPRGQAEADVVWEWYDLICPFCYVAQPQSALLERSGLRVAELGFEVHPETPAGGRFVGPRHGPMYEALQEQARRAGLPLRWPDRIANSRRALGAVEWVRQAEPEHVAAFRGALFRAHFALSEDISDDAVILRHAADAGVAVDVLTSALAANAGNELLLRSERSARSIGVDSTPSWLLPRRRLVRGLLPQELLDEMAASHGRPATVRPDEPRDADP